MLYGIDLLGRWQSTTDYRNVSGCYL